MTRIPSVNSIPLSKRKLRCLGVAAIARSSALNAATYDSFPCQFCFAEVKKQRHFELCNIQVSEHLRNMSIVEATDYLWIDQHFAVNNKVWNELANELSPVMN